MVVSKVVVFLGLILAALMSVACSQSAAPAPAPAPTSDVFDPMDKKDTCNQCYENRFGHRLDQGTGLVGQRSNR
ncbi:hypothetical protein JHK84_035647 [Glycine max]|uniref:Uncharacterized protein n=1 Tax=Glycine soja TaxID=3848 RepID=A0A445HAL5_GLYSO|nr:hypothetical protein JHK85_035959 [Glycine max]KAG5129250.1 hypothetical protein JHK84_035647 [Glycine max]RZB70809.1 hypothetical protein D0Y65_035672 [Glycine soja]